ncbi:hypothetical protein CRUP_015889 [Coryphaenoides rupestris]|nr:hypothetical protein CRUP_015889 [Coryphaenoides rupestris]
MVGLRNRSTWEPLLLKASCIRSCANGCSLGVTTDLIYANTDSESVEGVFVYPLGEKEVVVGFEAVIAGRLVGVQIQSRGKLKDCCLDCCPGAGLPGGGDGGCGSGGDGREWGGCCGGSGLDMKCGGIATHHLEDRVEVEPSPRARRPFRPRETTGQCRKGVGVRCWNTRTMRLPKVCSAFKRTLTGHNELSLDLRGGAVELDR